MKNLIIQLTENRDKGFVYRMISTESQLKQIEKNHTAKGFKAFEIDIIDETSNKMRMQDIRGYNNFLRDIKY